MSEIKSPCVLVCAIEPVSGHCYGCGRTREEIGAWMNFSPQVRDHLMAEELPQRVAKLERRPRRVTRRARMRGEVQASRTTSLEEKEL